MMISGGKMERKSYRISVSDSCVHDTLVKIFTQKTLNTDSISYTSFLSIFLTNRTKIQYVYLQMTEDEMENPWMDGFYFTLYLF